MAHTFLADCQNLHEVVGLIDIKHLAPSSLDVRTLRQSAASLPEAFLQRIGYTPHEIHHLQALYAGHIG
jgi:hypothetical protein